MRIGYYQFDVKFCDKNYNLNKIDNALKNASLDLLVLPELFTTGILFSGSHQMKSQAEPVPNGYTCNKMIEIARKNKCVMIGSVLENDGEVLYNTAIVTGPQGFIGKQRKVHLTDYEKNLFGHGEEFNIFELNGVKVGILICFDCWFPEAVRVLSSQGAQIICHSANIESPLTYDVVRVRALESISYIVSCNRIGSEKNDHLIYNFRGESRIIDFGGNIIAVSGNSEELQAVEIDPKKTIIKQYPECKDLFSEIAIYKEFYQDKVKQ